MAETIGIPIISDLAAMVLTSGVISRQIIPRVTFSTFAIGHVFAVLNLVFIDLRAHLQFVVPSIILFAAMSFAQVVIAGTLQADLRGCCGVDFLTSR